MLRGNVLPVRTMIRELINILNCVLSGTPSPWRYPGSGLGHRVPVLVAVGTPGRRT